MTPEENSKKLLEIENKEKGSKKDNGKKTLGNEERDKLKIENKS